LPLRRLLFVVCTASFVPRPATAVHYEVFIDIETEEDLYDLLVTGQISEASFGALLQLHQTRVELNRAGREKLYLLPNIDFTDVDGILAYRDEVGSIHTLGDLVAAGVLERKVADSLRAFVMVRPLEVGKGRADGFVRAQTRWTGRYDRLPPATALQGRIHALGHLDAGAVAALTRNRLSRVRWDPIRGGLSVEPERVRLEAPKAYVEWEDDAWELIAGTYRIGFGQRLTFDVTDQVTPNGAFGDYELRRENELTLRCRRVPGELAASPCPGDRTVRVTPDFAWTNRLTGVAVGSKHLPAGSGWLQTYGWGSYQVHRAQQIEIVDGGRCRDPRRDEDPDCAAPAVYVRGDDPSEPASVTRYASLPRVFAEALAGAHVSYFWQARVHLGVTGYGAIPRWLVDGVELDFQELARRPFGGPFGAVGVDAAYGFRRQDFFAEVARSFDRQANRGGGYGALLRSVTTLATGELDVAARYYGPRFANPYARPVSAPDELDGLRARDEVGLRVRTAMKLRPRLSMWSLADGWRPLSSPHWKGLLATRLDARLAPAWGWATWVEYQTSGRFLWAAKLTYEPVRRLTASCQLQHRLVRAASLFTRVRHDLAAIVNVSTRPIEVLRVRLRARYDFEDVADNHRLAQVLWSHVEAELSIRTRDTLRIRYDLRIFLDKRESTRRRRPNPEHWLWLEYVVRY